MKEDLEEFRSLLGKNSWLPAEDAFPAHPCVGDMTKTDTAL